jgi:hypothetical protein
MLGRPDLRRRTATQNGFPAFLKATLQLSRRVTKAKLLVRLDAASETVIGLHHAHGTSEQFHSLSESLAITLCLEKP